MNATTPRKGHIVVFGNEKGGSGKSTTCMHVIVALLRLGKSVGAIDLDPRQRSLMRYIENRAAWAERMNLDLPFPRPQVIERSKRDSATEAQAEEKERFQAVLAEMQAAHDFVVIDTPGTDSYIQRLGHSVADTLVTPMNDSFVDFDLLARTDPESLKILGPSLYSELVWESRKRRAMTDRASIDWIVMRNRVSSIDARNKRRIGEALEALSTRIGFRIAPGLGERVIFRELFPFGLTLMDIKEGGYNKPMTMSHVAARQEMRELMAALKLPGVEKLPQRQAAHAFG